MSWKSLGYINVHEGSGESFFGWERARGDEDFSDVVEIAEPRIEQRIPSVGFGMVTIDSNGGVGLEYSVDDAPKTAMKVSREGVGSSSLIVRPERSTGQKDESDYVNLRRKPKAEFTVSDPRQNPAFWNPGPDYNPNYAKGETFSRQEAMTAENRRRTSGNWRPPKDSRVRFIPKRGEHLLHVSTPPLSALNPDGQIRNRLTIGSPNNPVTKRLWDKDQSKRR
jgi:hypothetical protein